MKCDNILSSKKCRLRACNGTTDTMGHFFCLQKSNYSFTKISCKAFVLSKKGTSERIKLTKHTVTKLSQSFYS